MNTLYSTLLLLSSYLFVFIWTSSPLTEQTTPLIGILSIIYILTNTNFINRLHLPAKPKLWETTNFFVLNTTVLLLITLTGKLDSPLFFLLYFLNFAIAFSLQPTAVFTASIATLLLFSPQLTQNNVFENAIRLFSIVLLAPLAYFFGREIRIRQKEEKKIRSLEKEAIQASEKITKDVIDLVTNEGKNLQNNDVEKLHDIITQTRQLKKEAKENH